MGKRLGIIGGLSPESTLDYYRYITKKWTEATGRENYPEIVIYSVDFENFVKNKYIKKDKIKDIFHYFKLLNVDFVIAACNSIHVIYNDLLKDIEIPWLHIAECVVSEVVRCEIKRIGLIGTNFTMEDDFYSKIFLKNGIEVVIPNLKEIRIINDIIYNELVFGIYKKSSKMRLINIISSLESRGCEGVILGCTELPLLLKEYTSSLNLFDSAKIHCDKTISYLLGV